MAYNKKLVLNLILKKGLIPNNVIFKLNRNERSFILQHIDDLLCAKEWVVASIKPINPLFTDITLSFLNKSFIHTRSFVHIARCHIKHLPNLFEFANG